MREGSDLVHQYLTLIQIQGNILSYIFDAEEFCHRKRALEDCLPRLVTVADQILTPLYLCKNIRDAHHVLLLKGKGMRRGQNRKNKDMPCLLSSRFACIQEAAVLRQKSLVAVDTISKAGFVWVCPFSHRLMRGRYDAGRDWIKVRAVRI